MSNIVIFIIGALTGLFVGGFLGVLLGAFIIKRFNVPDTVINGRNKAKNGGVINLKNLFKRKK